MFHSKHFPHKFQTYPMTTMPTPSVQSDPHSLPPSPVGQISLDRIKARFSSYIPDYFIRVIETVGIPYYKLDVLALTRENPPIPPVDEAILKLVEQGVNTREALSSLLGIGGRLLFSRLVELSRTEMITTCAAGDGAERFALTDKGRDQIHNMGRLQVCERVIGDIYFNAITREPEVIGDAPFFAKQDELKADGIQSFVAPYPKAPPTSDDITPASLTKFIPQFQLPPRNASLVRPAPTVSLLAVKAVSKKPKPRLVYRTAVLIVYAPLNGVGPEHHVFVVDGRSREDLNSAFASSKGATRHDWLVPDQSIKNSGIPVEVLNSAVEADKAANEIKADIEERRQKIQNISAMDLDRPDTRVVQQKKIDELQAEIEVLQKRAEKSATLSTTKTIWSLDIRDKFDEALRSAQQNLLVISGFLSSGVVNRAFCERLEKLLVKGVNVYLGYGFDAHGVRGQMDREKPLFRDAVTLLDALAHKYPNLRHHDIGNTHAKILICDDKFRINGSYNFLSFRAEYRNGQPVRDESATLITDPVFCRSDFEEVRKRYFP